MDTNDRKSAGSRRQFLFHSAKTFLVSIVVPQHIFASVSKSEASAKAAYKLPLPEASWQLSDLNGTGRQNITLQQYGNGVTFQAAPSPSALPTEQPHNYIAAFDGKSALTAKRKPAVVLPRAESFSVVVRARLVKGGGLLHTPSFALVALDTGLIVAILPLRDERGHMYVEIPLSIVQLNEWHNMVVRFRNNVLDFFCNGVLLNKLKIAGTLSPIDNDSIFIGNWNLLSAPGGAFPDEIRSFLFERMLTGAIDHVAIWNRWLRDNDIAVLSGTNSVKIAEKPLYEKALSAYRRFHDASRRGNEEECARTAQTMRRFMSADSSRPVYHLTAPLDGIMDPAGAFYHQGQYHVYSYRNMVSMLACTPLAHFVSDDLVHWRDAPIGVWADSPLDVYGIWLGNIFYDDAGEPKMLYTALGKEGKIGVLASAKKDLTEFADKRAVITDRVHHDGHTWKQDGKWYTITTLQHWGKGEGMLGDAITLLQSEDLLNWTEVGEVFRVSKDANPVSRQQETGFSEYPYLLPFGDRYALITGNRPVRYWIGDFDVGSGRFIPDNDQHQYLDHLNPFHCFNPSIIDNKGAGGTTRRVMLSMHLYASGEVEGLRWYGVHTSPRTLDMRGGRLYQEPVRELNELRHDEVSLQHRTISAGQRLLLAGDAGNVVDCEAVFTDFNDAVFGISIRAGAEPSLTTLTIDASERIFHIEGNLKVPGKLYPELGRGPLHALRRNRIDVRVLIDKCLLEVFVNGQSATGILGKCDSSLTFELFASKGTCGLKTASVWKMKPAWPFDVAVKK